MISSCKHNCKLTKVLILGSSGFAGRNIAEKISENFCVVKTSRKRSFDNDTVYFDFFDSGSWINIINESPDVIINAAAYGVVKLQTDLDTMYKTNYFLACDLFDYLYSNGCNAYWLQLGTAFEYDLSAQHINEESPCIPKTHYGISKLMMSNYLLSKAKQGTFSIFRPFGMFGKYEDDSKFFPFLINAQKTSSPIELSAGTQKRDYIYVGDLGRFINELLIKKEIRNIPSVLNIGRGEAISFRAYASILQTMFPSFNATLWQWGKLNFRAGESEMFYSASEKAAKLGFINSNLEESFKETVQYYLLK